MHRYAFIAILMAVFIAAAEASLVVEKEMEAGEIERVRMENDILSVEIVRRGGKVASLRDRRTGREFVVFDGQLMDGFFKHREWHTGNIELMAALYDITVAEDSPSSAVVEVEYEAQTGNFSGMLFRKTYILGKDTAYLKVKQEVVSLREDNYFTINIHNLMPLEGFPGGDTHFYARSEDGPVRFSVTEGRRSTNNLVYEASEPWMAMVYGEGREGLAFIQRDEIELDNLYFYVGQDRATMEWAYERRRLRPAAEVDRWETEYRVAALKGLASVCGVASGMLYSVEEEGGAARLMLYPLSEAGESEVVISYKGEEIARERVELSAGEVRGIGFDAPFEGKTEEVEVLVRTPRREIAFFAEATIEDERHYALPTHEIIRREVEDFIEGFYYYFTEFNVSPDVTVPVGLGIRGNFRGREGFRLVIEAPEGINIKSARPDERDERREVEIDGEPYTRYEFHDTGISDRRIAVELFVGSDIEECREGLKINYYAEWDGGNQIKEILPLNIVRMPEYVPDAGRIVAGVEIGVRRIVENYPDMAENLRNAGVNFVSAGVASWSLGTVEYQGKEAYLDMIEPLEEGGVKVATANIGFPFSRFRDVWQDRYGTYELAGTLYYPEGEFVEGGEFEDFDIDEMKAVNRRGEIVEQMCPSYRGRFYMNTLDNVRVLIDYGYKRLLYNEEQWGRGREICYCGRCKERFGEFLAAEHPGLEYAPPEEITSEPDRHEELYDAWWDFKFTMVQEKYEGMREVATEHGGEEIEIWNWVCASISREGFSWNRLTSYAHLAGPHDVLIPMVYTRNMPDSKRVGDRAEVLWERAAARAKPVMGLSPARTYEIDRLRRQDFPSAESVKYQIFEGVSGGARGYLIWSPLSALEGALSYRYMAEAMRAIAPVEDIIADGRPAGDLRVVRGGAHARGMELDGEAVIMAAEYSSDRVIAEVEFQVERESTVRDLETGELIAEIGPDAPVFEVILDERRARLFHVEGHIR